MKRCTPLLYLLSVGFLASVAILLPLPVSAAPQCGTFEIVPTPNPGASSSSLIDIAVVGDGTVWAIGSQSGGETSGLILYYDGNQWDEYPIPAEAEDVAFGAIGNTPEGDVWFVGTRSYSVYEVEVFYLRARNGVIDRIDSFLNGGGPVDVFASAADEVWGVSGGIWPVDQGGYVQHFDSSGWETTQLPAAFIYRNQPQGIFATGPEDIWVAGYGGDGRAEYIGYVQHWDGTSWETVPTPFDDQNLTYFLSIDGSSPDDIWIAGHINHAEDILMHWDGSSWTQHAGPATSTALSEVITPGTGNAWAMPYSLDPANPFFYWDGDDWTEGTVLDIPGAVTVNWHNLSRGGTCEVWAVGSYHDGTTHHTLTAKLVADTDSETSSVDDRTPLAVTLLGNHPNPFNPSTKISFALPSQQTVGLHIYSADGRLVRTLLSGLQNAGVHDVMWNGRDSCAYHKFRPY